MLPLHLQPESHIPLYVQLRDQLRALVHCGELRDGDRIPASRELPRQPAWRTFTGRPSPNAYAELESEGLIQKATSAAAPIFCDSAVVRHFTPAPRTKWQWLVAVCWSGSRCSRTSAAKKA